MENRSEGQRYPHNCTECRFLGPYRDADLWFCPQSGWGAPTVIARWGSAPGDYESGLHIAKAQRSRLDLEAPLAVALARAEKKGYLVRPPGVSAEESRINLDLGVIALEAGITIPPESLVDRVHKSFRSEESIELAKEIQSRLAQYVYSPIDRDIKLRIQREIVQILQHKLHEVWARAFVDPAS